MDKWFWLAGGLVAGYFLFGKGGLASGGFKTSLEVGGAVGGSRPVDEPVPASNPVALVGDYNPVGAANYAQDASQRTQYVRNRMNGGVIS